MRPGHDHPVTTGKGIRYRLRATIDGKRESLGCFDTIDEARAQSQAYFELLHDHSKSLTVAAWGRQWLDDREERGTHRSIKDTRALWDRHIFPSALAPLTLRSVKQRHVQEWLRELIAQRATQGPRKDKPLAEQTVRNALNALSSAFSDAVAAGRAGGNPCKGVRVPRQARTDEDWTYLTNDEIRALFDLPDLPAKQRAAFTVAIYTGLRAGEIWGLRWEDVDFDEREILVRHSFDGPTKGERSVASRCSRLYSRSSRAGGAETTSRGRQASSFTPETEPCTPRDMTRGGPRNGVLRPASGLACVSTIFGIRAQAI